MSIAKFYAKCKPKKYLFFIFLISVQTNMVNNNITYIHIHAEIISEFDMYTQMINYIYNYLSLWWKISIKQMVQDLMNKISYFFLSFINIKNVISCSWLFMSVKEEISWGYGSFSSNFCAGFQAAEEKAALPLLQTWYQSMFFLINEKNYS